MPLLVPQPTHAQTPCSRFGVFLVAALVAACGAPAHAADALGANSGALAYLTWTATDKTDGDIAGDQATVDLFVYVERAAGLSFKGAELDLTWVPQGDGETCLLHTGDLYRTSTTCTYLNRGTPVPIVTADEPGHYHVAWANTASLTTCTAGAIVQMQFEIDGCADPSACFVLNSLTLLDATGKTDVASIVGWSATINGGSQYCTDTNHPPVLDPIGPKSADEGYSLYFLVNATDADGDVLTYAASPLPPGATFIGREFSWLPTGDQLGDWPVLFTVADPRGQADSESVVITVLPGRCVLDQPPVFTPTADQAGEVGVGFSFAVFASDADDDQLTYSALSLPPGAVLTSQLVTWTPTVDDIGRFEAVFRVEDACAKADTDTVAITIGPDLPVHHVDPTSTCTECDGSTWATALHTVGQGMNLSNTGDSLLVAEGMYHEGPLTLPATMVVVGGYPNGGGERDASRHRTVFMPTPGNEELTILYVGTANSRVDGLTVSGASRAMTAFGVYASNVTVLGTFITGNTVRLAPLFVGSGSNAQFFGCLLSNNRIIESGAPAYVSAQTSATFSNCTIAYNKLSVYYSTAGGIYNGGSAIVRNTIVWGWGPSYQPAFFDVGTLLVGYSDVFGGWPGAGNINADPLFCNPAKRNFALMAGSPCIGAGYHGSTIGAIDDVCGARPDLPPLLTTSDGTSADTPATALRLIGGAGTGVQGVAYTLTREDAVALDVFDTRGAHVRTLVNARQSGGPHVVAWDGLDERGRRVAAGVYVLRLVTERERVTRRLVIAR